MNAFLWSVIVTVLLVASGCLALTILGAAIVWVGVGIVYVIDKVKEL